jgi:Xaa-Pro aminopeptidase
MNGVLRKKISALPNIESTINADEIPIILEEEYLHRIQAALQQSTDKYSYLIIYADREHFSNMEYFTGYDPRFEEALLILSEGQAPTIIVGNEGKSYAEKIPYDINIVVYPFFSLPNQPRNKNTKLSDILKDVGIQKDSKVGIIGWKFFDKEDFQDSQQQYDLPFFIMSEIFKIVEMKNLENATAIMVGNENGLRHNLDAKELVLCEIAGTKTSRNTYNVLRNLKDGISEQEASKFLNIDGDPLIAHPNISFGKNIFYALASPSSKRRLHNGDLVAVGMGYRRSMCHKVSFFVNNASELNAEAQSIYDIYFQAITKWYERVAVGSVAGEVYKAVKNIVADFAKMGIGLNPGHLIHTDEWTNSPFVEGSEIVLCSGMAIQCDFTASLPELNISVHAEDGIILASNEMQKEINEIAPQAYQRMINRREFMIHVLGIHIDATVLPTSDMPAVIFPYLRDLNYVLANE